MENCSATVDFINEWQRACSCSGDDCAGCPLSIFKSAPYQTDTCTDFLVLYPEKAVEVLQKWSNENPKKTLLDKLLEENPNVRLINGVPAFSPVDIGYLPVEMADYVDSIGPNVWFASEDYFSQNKCHAAQSEPAEENDSVDDDDLNAFFASLVEKADKSNNGRLISGDVLAALLGLLRG